MGCQNIVWRISIIPTGQGIIEHLVIYTKVSKISKFLKFSGQKVNTNNLPCVYIEYILLFTGKNKPVTVIIKKKKKKI